MKKKLVLSTLLAYSAVAHAQSPTLIASFDTPSFVIAILVGLVIALGFQFLLTVLSIASGISAIGDIKHNYVEGKYHLSHDGEDNHHEDSSDNIDNKGVKIVSGIGLWNLITATISLFGATAIALNLSPIDVLSVKIALALSIWAAFYLIVFILEFKVASGLIGGLINTALAGVKSSGQAIGSLFQSSPEKKIDNVLQHTVEKVRSEFDSINNTDQIKETLDIHFKDLKKGLPSYERIKNDLAALVKDNKTQQPSPQKWMTIQKVLTSAINSNSGGNSEKVDQLKTIIQDMKDASTHGDSAMEKMENILKATPVDNQKVDRLIRKIQDALSSVDFSEDQDASFQQKIDEILSKSENSYQDIQAAIQRFDREKLRTVLHEETDIDNSKVDEYLDKAFDLITTVKERVGITNNDAFTPNLLESLENRIKGFVDSTDNSELNYDLLKRDLVKIWNNPKDSLEIIKNRLSTFDSDTLTSIITNNEYIDRKDIDSVKHQIEQTKKDALDKVNQIETKARQQVSMLEKKAVIQAEKARKVAVTAAWWLVATIVLSGAAAIGGSILTL